MASAVYAINDIFDVASDKTHPVKKNRPLPSGRLEKKILIGLLLFLIVVSVFISSFFVSKAVTYIIISYLILNIFYSTVFKKILVFDIIVLTSFYLLRILAGAIVAGVSLSLTSLVYLSLFFFSLAALKRFLSFQQSLKSVMTETHKKLIERNMFLLSLIVNMSSLVVFVSVLSTSEDVLRFSHPIALWCGLIVIIVWSARLWKNSWNRLVDCDLATYVIKDRISWLMLSAFCFLYWTSL